VSVRALVISDTHFGAWTGEDILRDPENLALLEPHLDVDEVIFLGDLFDLLFGRFSDALNAAEGLLGLVRDRLQGKRFVFLAGNHDHPMVSRQREAQLELELVTGKRADELRADAHRLNLLRTYLERQLEGVEVDIRYPTYTFAGVLCTHGHYLDFYARRGGSRAAKLLARTLWSVAVGGDDHDPTVDDYEATVAMLTGLLFTIAQLPNGTRAQRRIFRGFQHFGRTIHAGTAPVRTVEHAGLRLASRLRPHPRDRLQPSPQAELEAYRGAVAYEAKRRERTGAPAGAEANYAMARFVRPTDPAGPAVAAFERVIEHLGWAGETDKIVFAHTHQPLEAVTGPSGRWRYWNTGSWIYEPELGSHDAYMRYLRNAWPGTAVLIDSEEPEPRLLRLREHLNPLNRMR
jgi:UDP-2,3-diacylglucosamine pyrophosphatase LpxH